MYHKSLSVCVLSALTLTACGPNDVTVSRFNQPISDNSFILPILSNETVGSDTIRTGQGYVYRIGTNPSDGAVAEAGLISSTRVDAQPTSGTVVYTGRFESARLSDVSTSGSTLTAIPITTSGPVELEANFNDNTLRTTDRDQFLGVDATVRNGEISGTVTVVGIEGRLEGVIDDNEAIGAFHGNNATTTYSGGFIAVN